jgi:phenylpropionate dioxygenase-like ring-hydroxylating dioxygenase large terminal subunit
MASEGLTDKLPPTPMERAQAADLGHDLIPKDRYTAPAYKTLEWDRMWTRTWLMAGFESDLAEPGDYFTFEIGDESLLLVRQRDGQIGARYNVCTHRGNRLREPGRGKASAFACAYHGWRFGLDGALESVHDEETFPQGCPRDRLSLEPVLCETWGGFVFVNLDPDAAPLSDHLAEIPAHLDPYHFAEMSIVDDVSLDVDCNWKTSLDAFNEAYHIAGTHPDTLDVNDDVNVPIDCYDKHSRMLLKLALASPRHPEHGQVTEGIKQGFLATAGIDPETFDGGAADVRPAIVRAVRAVQGPALGADFSELLDEQLVDDFHYTIFPNLTLNIFGRNAWLFRHRPHPDDPNKMVFDFFNLVRAPSVGMPRAPHRHLEPSDSQGYEPVGGGGGLLAQDWYNLPRIQRGMRSRAFKGLHLGQQEIRIRHFHEVLERTIRER